MYCVRFPAGRTPSDKVMLQASKGSYASTAPTSLHDQDGRVYDIIHDSPTVDAYLQRGGNNVIVSHRGTQNPMDMLSNLHVIMNHMTLSPRYNSDREEVKRIQERYAPQTHNYYFTGHSLGGALAKEFVRQMTDDPSLHSPTWGQPDGQIKGIVFNSALQAKDMTDELRNVRKHYMDKDPLYDGLLGPVPLPTRQFGKHLRHEVRVHPTVCPERHFSCGRFDFPCWARQAARTTKCMAWSANPIRAHPITVLEKVV